MILELIGDAIVSGGITWGVLSLKKRFGKFKVKADAMGAFPFLYKVHKENDGFYCPKCTSMSKNNNQAPHCTCEEYHTGHFHFKCNDCSFKTIMREADSK